MIAVSVKTATPSALARVSADHTYCHVVDGVRRRRRVHGTSNGGVNGGVEKRALRAVVEGGEELADTRIGQATRFVRTFAEIVYSAVFARATKPALCVYPLIRGCSIADIARALNAGSRELLALLC